MTVTPFNSALFAGSLNDPQVSQLFSDAAQIRAMLRVEAALARAQGAIGVIPEEAADIIERTCAAWTPEPEDFAGGTARDGIVVPALVAGLRQAVGEPYASHVHFGATSQDIIDTAFVLCLRSALDVIGPRLDDLCATLANLADAHRPTLCLSRTRAMQAVPTVFGLKVANWLAPVVRARDELEAVRKASLVLSLGGAAGTMSALGQQAIETAEAMAKVLKLAAASTPWHTQRDRMAAIAGWMARLCGSLGKMGADMVILAQSEVGEISFEGAGGSSTMPNKANPVAAEILVSMGRYAALLAGAMHEAQIAGNERDGSAWMLEWLALPQMACAAGCASARALDAVRTLRIDQSRMRSNLDASNGLVLAEAATFALMEAGFDRAEASGFVKQACGRTANGEHMVDALHDLVEEADVDWDALRNPANAIGQADELIDRGLAEAGIEQD
ncbi:MAG: 3-carboxy-cis,cis-muconate cycloisomerase [Rhodobiaceae bacterium]|nr:3-carboxy-cis,cis-muconate cycloisomerase [Rhodobiaceae bacterium]MCC0050138.1 3-carboxy-cis,cis-muconate cycloisomerase [Rhodobiaceae bacterium]